MSLPTLIICEAGEDKAKQIEELIRAHTELRLIGTVNRQTAAKQIAALSPKLVWIELAPEPMKALTLLGDLREQHPKVQFLVSNETLDGGLIKTSMQLGATDFLDSQTWKDQLPDVVKRIVLKAEQLNAPAATAALAPAAPAPASAKDKDAMPPGLAAALADGDDEPGPARPAVAATAPADSLANQKKTGTTAAMSSTSRGKEIKGSATASPAWIWAIILGLFGLSFLFYKLFP
ncbi:MAG: response regulator transcription factor [Candidatus Melainabacteria bacterium]|nr:response regulator transcription factor [Candidatus Melainabacteria bacterium]